jgi:hemerythrin-like domain-containing protein
MEKEEAKLEFVKEFKRLVPNFQQHLEDEEQAERTRQAQNLELEKENKIREEKARETELERQKEELQRRSIQVLENLSSYRY